MEYDDDAAIVESKFRDVDVVIDVFISPSDFKDLCTKEMMPPPRRRVAVVLRPGITDALDVESTDNLFDVNRTDAFLTVSHFTNDDLDEEYAERRAQQIGVVYVYEDESITQTLVPAIASLAREPHEVGAMEFGSSLATCTESSNVLRWLFVGAPSRRHRRGAVYVFRSDRSSISESWNEFTQTQQLGLFTESLPGDDFGLHLSAFSRWNEITTLAVSVPGLDTSYTGGICMDIPNWHDDLGRGCTFYDDINTFQCNETAKLACCACGYEGYKGVSNVSHTGGGGVAIFVRSPLNDVFLLDQIVRAPTSFYEEEIGFGASIALDRELLVVGAPKEGLKRTESYSSVSTRILRRVGAVYIYRRTHGISGSFRFSQRIVHDDAEAHDSFGERVALSGHILLVSRKSYTLRSRTPRYAVLKIQTKATSTIGGSFVLTFRKRKMNWSRNGWNRVLCYPGTTVPCHPKEKDYYCTPCPETVDQDAAPSATMRLIHDISAIDLHDHLTSLLGSERIIVSRTVSDAHGGHTWTIMFIVDASDDVLEDFFESGTLEAHSFLTGNDVNIDVRVVSADRAPAKHRKSVYVFTRLTNKKMFQEQALLEPHYEQQTDE